MISILIVIIIGSCTKSKIRSATVTYYCSCNLQPNQKLVITFDNSNSVPITDTLTNGNYSVTVNYTSGNQPTMKESFSAYILGTHSPAGINLKTVSNGITNTTFTADCCLAYISFSF
ncbi:MAG: hypothetical protein ABI388_09285 [Bacteroidia bacterium]